MSVCVGVGVYVWGVCVYVWGVCMCVCMHIYTCMCVDMSVCMSVHIWCGKRSPF